MARDRVVTVNPATSPKVQINVKTGCSGKTVIPGLEKLNNSTAAFDVSMSWQEAFKRLWNVDIDALKYSIQKGGQQGLTKTKHSVREEISLLLSEFKKVRSTFTVYVVENKFREMKNVTEPRPPRLSPMGAGGRPLQQGGGRVVQVDVDFSGANAGRGVEGRGPRGSDQRNGALMGNSNVPTGIKRPLNGANAAKGSAKATVTSGQNGNSHSGNRGRFPRSAAQATGSGSGPAETVLLPSPLKRNRQVEEFDDHFFKRQRGPPNSSANGPRVQKNVTEDDEDARSDITTASQDSQIGDLQELGIAHDDLKGAFCNKAQRNVSNTQFLMAKHELEQLKKNNSIRWTKWTTTAPVTSNIIRDLFNV